MRIQSLEVETTHWFKARIKFEGILSLEVRESASLLFTALVRLRRETDGKFHRLIFGRNRAVTLANDQWRLNPRPLSK